jgi:hypothetical protein
MNGASSIDRIASAAPNHNRVALGAVRTSRGSLADVGDGLNLSVAVAVGFIALAGVAAETGVVMLIYLDSAVTDLQTGRSAEGRPFARDDLRAAIMSQHDGAEPCGAVEPPSRRRADLLAFLKDATQPGLLVTPSSSLGTDGQIRQRVSVCTPVSWHPVDTIPDLSDKACAGFRPAKFPMSLAAVRSADRSGDPGPHHQSTTSARLYFSCEYKRIVQRIF